MITSISNKAVVNNTTTKKQTAQPKQIAFSATPDQFLKIRFQRLEGHTGRTFCIDKDKVLIWFDDIARRAANALKPGQSLSLKKGATVPEGDVFKEFAKKRDRNYGSNPNVSIGDALQSFLKEHNLEFDKLSKKNPKLPGTLGISKIEKTDVLEKGGHSTLEGLLKELKEKDLLQKPDDLFPSLLAGRDLKTKNPDILLIRH